MMCCGTANRHTLHTAMITQCHLQDKETLWQKILFFVNIRIAKKSVNSSKIIFPIKVMSLNERHDGLDRRLLDCLFESVSRSTANQSSALLALCIENPPLTDGFPSQRASYAESVSMSWRHHARATSGAGQQSTGGHGVSCLINWLMWQAYHISRLTNISFDVIEYIPGIISTVHALVWWSTGDMMMSSNGNIFHVIGPLWGKFTGHQWIPLTKANGSELWCFLWSAPEQTVEQTVETLVIWDAIALIMTPL